MISIGRKYCIIFAYEMEEGMEESLLSLICYPTKLNSPPISFIDKSQEAQKLHHCDVASIICMMLPTFIIILGVRNQKELN